MYNPGIKREWEAEYKMQPLSKAMPILGLSWNFGIDVTKSVSRQMPFKISSSYLHSWTAVLEHSNVQH